MAAKRATATIPIVMAVVGDPVKLGLVASFRQPGGNVTGLTLVGAERTEKQLQLLKEILPGTSSVAVLYNAANSSTPDGLADARRAASLLKFSLQLVPVRGPEDLETAFAQIINARSDAFVTLGDGMLLGSHRRIAEFGVRSRLPGVFPEREFADAGGIAAYGPNVAANFRRAAGFVASILKGAKPSDLPVEQPTKYDVVINMKTAKAIGLKVPPAVLVRADEIIE
jgi:putative ABC transport system substrate-binding protein